MGGRVLITARSVSGHAPALQLLRDAGCEVVLESNVAPFDEARLAAQVPGFEAIVFTLEPTTRRVIEAARGLRIVARPGVGYDTVDLKACTERRIPVTISPVNDQSVADFALGLMLDVARGITTAVNGVQAHGWERVTGRELWRKTLTIVGLGRIGRGLAQRARGFEMRVLAVDDHRDAAYAAQHGIEYVSLEDGLRAGDFISLHVPLTPATEALINAGRLALMKRGAFLINTARGGLLDEAAVVAAVKRGQLGGAAVDVLRQQGANSASPLIGVPGIIVTPHMATFTVESMQRVAMSVAHNILAVFAGGRPEGVVNPEVYA